MMSPLQGVLYISMKHKYIHAKAIFSVKINQFNREGDRLPYWDPALDQHV